jgi:hypothetical protein
MLSAILFPGDHSFKDRDLFVPSNIISSSRNSICLFPAFLLAPNGAIESINHIIVNINGSKKTGFTSFPRQHPPARHIQTRAA